jgi:hypothetical protein
VRIKPEIPQATRQLLAAAADIRGTFPQPDLAVCCHQRPGLAVCPCANEHLAYTNQGAGGCGIHSQASLDQQLVKPLLVTGHQG